MITPSGFAKKRLLKKLFKNLPDNRILVDAGCAGGALSFDLDVQTKIALDFNLNLNARTQESMSGVECDISQIPLRDGCIDYVLCLDALEHIVDDNKVVEEFYRVLKNGGLIIITTPFKDCEYFPKLLRSFFKLDAVTLNKDYGHVRTGYSIEDLRCLLKDFNILSYDSFDGTITRMLDLLIYRPVFKLYNHGISFKQIGNEVRRNKLTEYIENVHDFLFPFVFGLPIIIGEKYVRLEHFIVGEKSEKISTD